MLSWLKIAIRVKPLELGFDGANQSPMKSVDANIKRGQKSMTKALLDKTTVHRAMYLQGSNDFAGGWVDFVWGDEGRVRPNGKTKGGKGISHIIEARMRKDKLTENEVMRFLVEKIPLVLAKGAISSHVKFNNVDDVKVTYQNYLVGLIKIKGGNAWAVTAFEVFV